MFVMMFRKLAVISLALVILFMAACSSPVAEVAETAVPPTSIPPTKVPPTTTPSPDELLIGAILADDVAVVQRILEAGADPNLESNRVHPMFVAVNKGNIEVVKLLIAYGGDVTVETASGTDLFEVATTEVLELLVAQLVPSDISPISVRTLTAPDSVRQLAETGVSANKDWTVYTEVINGVEMSLVPAGCFTMGSTDAQIEAAITIYPTDPLRFSDEQPAHEVCFDEPFLIDVYEVTNGQYGSSGRWDGDELPRETINWTDAFVYCKSRGGRLPTEAEWEYAARGPDNLYYPWGNEFEGSNVVYSQNSNSQTSPVGSRVGGRSWIGAYDLSGNVWEWVNDWYDANYPAEPQNNPQGPESGADHAVKGGDWYEDSILTRPANRAWPTWGALSNRTGFRCAGSS